MADSAERAVVRVSVAQRLDAVRNVVARRESQKQASQRLGVSKAAVCLWVKKGIPYWESAAASQGGRKKSMEPKFPLINDYMVKFLDATSRMPATAPRVANWNSLKHMALRKAAEIARDDPSHATFQASSGWLNELLKKNSFTRIHLQGISRSSVCTACKSGRYGCPAGEAGSVDRDRGEALRLMEEFKERLLATGVSRAGAIFNADETGLFYSWDSSKMEIDTWMGSTDSRGRGGREIIGPSPALLMSVKGCSATG
jgi:hypothetical protein